MPDAGSQAPELAAIISTGAELVFALACFAAPLVIGKVLVRHKENLPPPLLISLATLFTLLGIRQLVLLAVDILWLKALMDLAVAGAGIVVAWYMWRVLPWLLSIPTRDNLLSKTAELESNTEVLRHRIDSLTTLVGGVSHDFNNLLTVIGGHTQLIAQHTTGPEDRDSLNAINAAARRATDVCRQMLAYSGRGHFVLTQTDVNTVIDSIDPPRVEGCSITYSLSAAVAPINASEQQLQQMVNDLLANAIESIRDAGRTDGQVQISTSRTFLDEAALRRAAINPANRQGDYVMIEVRDNGRGIESSARDRIFEPYFSTKFTGRGLGMAAVRGIVEGHSASLFIDSEMGKGTAVRIAFPVLTTPPLQYRPATKRPPRLVLVVDDEADILSLARGHLEQLGIEVETTTDPIEALAIVRRRKSELDAVIVDYLMPRMTGSDLLAEIVAIKLVDAYVTSGYTQGEIDDPLLRDIMTGFIAKPFSRSDFQSLFAERRAA